MRRQPCCVCATAPHDSCNSSFYSLTSNAGSVILPIPLEVRTIDTPFCSGMGGRGEKRRKAMNSLRIALLTGAALAVSAAGAQADDLSALKAQIESLNARVASMEAAPAVPAGYSLLSIS